MPPPDKPKKNASLKLRKKHYYASRKYNGKETKTRTKKGKKYYKSRRSKARKRWKDSFGKNTPSYCFKTPGGFRCVPSTKKQCPSKGSCRKIKSNSKKLKKHETRKGNWTNTYRITNKRRR